MLRLALYWVCRAKLAELDCDESRVVCLLEQALLFSAQVSPYQAVVSSLFYLRNDTWLECVRRVIKARGKLVEHDGSLRVSLDEVECFSSFSSVLLTSQVHQ